MSKANSASCRQPTTTHQHIAVVSGRSGWGKSRLLDALCGQSARPVLLARALLPEREEPWSLARTLLQTPPTTAVDVRGLLGSTTLAALADVLPDLGAAGPAVDPRSRRARWSSRACCGSSRRPYRRWS